MRCEKCSKEYEGEKCGFCEIDDINSKFQIVADAEENL